MKKQPFIACEKCGVLYVGNHVCEEAGMVSEKPILFSGDMVRAILDGCKTQTRRIIKPQPPSSSPTKITPHILEGGRYGFFDECDNDYVCPYGKPGDTLWVRETWAAETVYDDMKPSEIPVDNVIWYKATDEDMTKNSMTVGKWRPSIFMCRWMSRIDLLVKRVWVERVQEASIENIIAEGCPAEHYPENCDGFPHAVSGWFEHLWDSINAKPKPAEGGKIYVSYPWSGKEWVEQYRGKDHYIIPNPYVWVVEFEVIK